MELADLRAVRYLLWATTGEGPRPRLDAALERELRRAGIIIPPAQTPRDVWLDARLDLAPASVSSDSGHLDARCVLARGPYAPPDIVGGADASEPFLPAEDILWIAAAGARLALPYTLTSRLARAIARTYGRPQTVLPPRAAAALRRVGAIDDRRAAARRREAWRRQEQSWRRELRRYGSVVLRGLFEPTFLAAVRVYYERIEREGYLLGGAARRRGAPLLHDEPFTDFLNGLLAPLVRHLTGERASATFSFLRVYDPGAILHPHRDRPSCRWNIDLVVGGEPAPSRGNAWPLQIDGRRGVRSVRLGLGDGVLYRGERVRHWRRAQPRGRTTVLAALHYGRPARHSSSAS